MSILRTSWLPLLALIIVGTLWWFRPGGIEGPRPKPVSPEGKRFEHSEFSAILKGLAAQEEIDYAALRQAPEALDHYLGQLRATSPKSAPHRFKTPEDRLAYYLNAYNAFALAAIRDHCPLESVQSLYLMDGFFWRISFLMGELEITLGDLEAEQISELVQGQGAVRLALIKGAKSSPPYLPEAYEGERLKEQLEKAARRALKRPQILKREGEVLKINPIFSWYQRDFGQDPKVFIKALAPAALEGDPRLEEQDFDWSLNGRCSATP